MHAFYAGLGRFTVKYRWVIVIVWLLGTFGAARALPTLASQVNNDNTAFLPNNAPDVLAANLAKPLVGKESLSPIIVIAVSPASTLTAADVKAVQREQELVSKAPHVKQALFLGISPNHRSIQIEALADVSGFGTGRASQSVSAVLASFAKDKAPPGLHFYIAGQVADSIAQNGASSSTGNKTQYLSVLFIIVLLFVIFRSVLAPFVTLLPAVVVLQLAGAFIGELGAHGLKISEVAQLLLIVLVLGAGTDYGLFLVYRVREGIRDGLDPKQAVALAVSRVGESISASAGTVIIALLSLLFATFGIYHDLGIPLAVGIATMLLAGLTLLPALLAILGRAVFWPTHPREGQPQEGLWGRVAARVVGRPVPTLVIGVAIFGALSVGVGWYQPAGFGGATTAPPHTDAATGDALLKAYFPRASTNPTNLILQYGFSVWDDPSVVTEAQIALETSGLFTKIEGPLDPTGASLPTAVFQRLHAELGPPKGLPELPPAGKGISVAEYEQYRAEAQFISADGHTIQFGASLEAGDPTSVAALNAVPALREELASVARSTRATANGVAGEAPALYDISSTSDSDLIHIIPIAALAIALLLALVLRSLVAPLYLIASVVLSYLAALGLASIVFIKIVGDNGLTFLLPFLMFIFLLALGEDYNILVMTRIREEAHDHELRDAVVRAVGVSGPTITSAGLVLAGSFTVLAVAGSQGPGGSQVRDIGVGLAVGILMDTFLVRTLLVPSTVALLGKWNWWPGRVEAEMGYPGTDKHHRRFHRASASAQVSAPASVDGAGAAATAPVAPATTPAPVASATTATTAEEPLAP
jgi:RND superfamily putative drug exporter